MSENYKGTIVSLKNLRKHIKADRLQCTNIFGNNIVVGINSKIGDVGIFFPVETALSAGFVYENNLSSVPELNKDGKTKGYFGSHGRVKAQTFREEKSMGFWLPINSLDYLNIPNEILKEGFELDEYNGLRICSKYVPRNSTTPGLGNKKAGKTYQKKESRILNNQFRFHYDTAQLGKNMHRIQPDDIISISWKLHGTSAIAAKILTKRKITFWERFANFLGANFDPVVYDYIYASRRVVKNEFLDDKQHYYKYDLWTEVGKENFHNKLQAGESVYYEIVGYTKDGGMIQKDFDYGCSAIPVTDYSKIAMSYNIGEEGNKIKPLYKIYVYRITKTGTDDNTIDLDWGQLKERCKELNVDYCPEIYYGKTINLYPQGTHNTEEEWREGLLDFLQKNYVYDQDSQFCADKVPEEGIVVRKEGLYLEAYKLKSFRFLEYESTQLDEKVVDIETQQSEGVEDDNTEG